MNALLEYNAVNNTKCVMVDKDLQNIAFIKQFFPNSRTLLCTFHVLKYIKTVIHKQELPLDKKKDLMAIFRAILYCKNEEEIEELKKKFDIYEDFKNYYYSNWETCKEMWMFIYRQQLLIFGTNTNNHIESFNRHIKRRIQPNMHMNECIQQLVNISNSLYENDVEKLIILKSRVDQ